jgi:hypothetical protein
VKAPGGLAGSTAYTVQRSEAARACHGPPDVHRAPRDGTALARPVPPSPVVLEGRWKVCYGLRAQRLQPWRMHGWHADVGCLANSHGVCCALSAALVRDTGQGLQTPLRAAQNVVSMCLFLANADFNRRAEATLTQLFAAGSTSLAKARR